jgi:hypothetical protein
MTAPDAPSARVFVNERGVDVPQGATALDAVRARDAAEADRVAAGERTLVDSRGLPTDSAAPAYPGAIYRTIAARSAPDA